jgi:hypothetical protein
VPFYNPRYKITLMKLTRLLALMAVLAAAPSVALADDAIAEAMKKYHKGETSLSKKVGAGEASSSELGQILSAYQAMAKVSPPKGTPSSWKEKCDELIAAVTALKGGNKAATSAYKKAVNCKACHDIHKEK